MSELQLYECVADLLIVARKQKRRITALTESRADAERRAAELAFIHTEDRSNLAIYKSRVKHLNQVIDLQNADAERMIELLRGLYLIYVGLREELEYMEFEQIVNILKVDEFGEDGEDAGPEDGDGGDNNPMPENLVMPF